MRPFSWVADSFQVSKILICTLFQSRASSYQGNVVRLLGVKINPKVTSGEPSKLPVRSYYLGELIFMLRSYYQFPLGLLFLSLIELLLIDHLPSLTEPNILQVHLELTLLLQSCNVNYISLSFCCSFQYTSSLATFSKETLFYFQGLGWGIRHFPVVISGFSMQFWDQNDQRSTSGQNDLKVNCRISNYQVSSISH